MQLALAFFDLKPVPTLRWSCVHAMRSAHGGNRDSVVVLQLSGAYDSHYSKEGGCRHGYPDPKHADRRVPHLWPAPAFRETLSLLDRVHARNPRLIDRTVTQNETARGSVPGGFVLGATHRDLVGRAVVGILNV